MPRKPTPPPAAGPAPEALLHFADQVATAAAPAPAPEPELQLVAFELDREEFGVPIGQVREVVRVSHVSRVPQAPPHIRGVVNLRGRILPVVELRTRLGLPPAELGPRSRILIVEVYGRTLGLLVDAVSRVVRVPRSAVVPPPEEVVSGRSDYITGVARLDPRLLILLDLDKALLLTVDSP